MENPKAPGESIRPAGRYEGPAGSKPAPSTDRPICVAIGDCDRAIEQRQKNIRTLWWWQALILILALGLIVTYIYFYHVLPRDGETSRDGDATASSLANTLILLIAAAYSLMFGVLMYAYRVHHREIGRLQRLKIDFLRIRVAAEEPDGYADEIVRQALLRQAFVSQETGSKGMESVPDFLKGDVRIETIAAAVKAAIDLLEQRRSDREKQVSCEEK